MYNYCAVVTLTLLICMHVLNYIYCRFGLRTLRGFLSLGGFALSDYTVLEAFTFSDALALSWLQCSLMYVLCQANLRFHLFMRSYSIKCSGNLAAMMPRIKCLSFRGSRTPGWFTSSEALTLYLSRMLYIFGGFMHYCTLGWFTSSEALALWQNKCPINAIFMCNKPEWLCLEALAFSDAFHRRRLTHSMLFIYACEASASSARAFSQQWENDYHLKARALSDVLHRRRLSHFHSRMLYIVGGSFTCWRHLLYAF